MRYEASPRRLSDPIIHWRENGQNHWLSRLERSCFISLLIANKLEKFRLCINLRCSLSYCDTIYSVYPTAEDSGTPVWVTCLTFVSDIQFIAPSMISPLRADLPASPGFSAPRSAAERTSLFSLALVTSSRDLGSISNSPRS